MRFSPRIVRKNILHSEGLPAARFQIDSKFTYVGNTSFTLYNAANVEQHHFVIANAMQRVERHLWFQFEGYFDTNEYKYRYSVPDSLTMGGLTFLHDADVMNIDDDYAERPTSDSAHVIDFMKQTGYTMEGDVIFNRFVWLAPNLRNELMIIYSEDLHPIGYNIPDLTNSVNTLDKRVQLFKVIHERALSSFRIETN